MSSLAEYPELVGFFSYSRDDDEDSDGALSRLRDRIQRELGSQLARSKADFRLWQDKAAIAHGTFWEKEIRLAIAQSVFFIPIVTPRAVRSRHCKQEFELFLAREAELGRDDLVFPIIYIPVPALEDERLWSQDPVLQIIGKRQFLDWRDLRQHDFATSLDVRVEVEHFCRNIANALRKPWLSAEERAQAEAQRKAEDERRRDEAAQAQRRAEAEKQRAKRETAARQKAEDERRAREAEEQRRREELKARQDAEEKERRKQTAASSERERLDKEAAQRRMSGLFQNLDARNKPAQSKGAAAASNLAVAALLGALGGVAIFGFVAILAMALTMIGLEVPVLFEPKVLGTVSVIGALLAFGAAYWGIDWRNLPK